MAHPRRGFSRNAQKRKSIWIGIAEGQNVLANAAAVISVANAELLDERPFTIVRTHLMIHWVSDQVAASELQLGAVGAAVVSDQAVAIGVTAVPTPVTDLTSDLWYMHQRFMNEFKLLSSVGFESNAGRVWEIDSKAMRKVVFGAQPIFVAESLTTIGDGGGQLTHAGRFLIKLQ